ncbi:heparinase II/III family protein, partial [Flavobacteriales bacterium]|nr:heparinase II/III family protein [Flavobacteriales bacterium]
KGFEFLNIQHKFNQINWNFNLHKKLWTYNLNYFDFLNQKEISEKQGLELITDFINKYDKLIDGKEPYPTSLRIINWIKFISTHKISDDSIYKLIRKDANRLMKNLEYHLLGNHLLENGFALFFAAHLFNDKKYFNLSSKILTKELNEQILEDGGHFELSPMYHNLMLYRVLDCIHIVQLNPIKHNRKILKFLKERAEKMLSWTENMTFNSEYMPLFNDSANGIVPNPGIIIDYAKTLNINSKKLTLSSSGYRKISTHNYELICDVGPIGASYQPGHGHADTFNFELYIKNNPIIVDTGTSTYNIGPIRSYERSTKAHNTVVVNDKNSSDVWSGFRVGKRADVFDLTETKESIKASHNGYSGINVTHSREWKHSKNEIIIKDSIQGKKDVKGVACFHFHPSVKTILNQNVLIIEPYCKIYFENQFELNISNYKYSPEFNTQLSSNCLEVSFKRNLTTKIKLFTD